MLCDKPITVLFRCWKPQTLADLTRLGSYLENQTKYDTAVLTMINTAVVNTKSRYTFRAARPHSPFVGVANKATDKPCQYIDSATSATANGKTMNEPRRNNFLGFELWTRRCLEPKLLSVLSVLSISKEAKTV